MTFLYPMNENTTFRTFLEIFIEKLPFTSVVVAIAKPSRDTVTPINGYLPVSSITVPLIVTAATSATISPLFCVVTVDIVSL